ncbi:hypothetical protein BOTBODRAFT_178283 [Botryobasidium botryosum FD-172 SS1]|uniref:CxC5 like cysteine cluster associated with KDZ domain-containing protein n=1 Tax=Botryobasidium botryosum (strain FD-172 SS1) TaxID=930990 RepID=A0A067M6C2_BOTB1|nr:hypothetical protein BOTBODRAFT_178283 [Botryobasidium botryosum FD-172 SS1]
MASTGSTILPQNMPPEPLDPTLIYRFLRLLHLTKAAIINHRRADAAAGYLPRSVNNFLSNALGKGLQTISYLWNTLGPSVPALDGALRASKEEIALLHTYGWDQGLSYRDFYSPYTVCPDRACPRFGQPLAVPLKYKATLFTLREGALPVFCNSLICQGCSTRYYHSYKVQKKAEIPTRVYYDNAAAPEVFQVTMHHFMESALLELFVNQMVFMWRVFGLKLCSDTDERDPNDFSTWTPSGWPSTLRLSPELVSDGFFLYSLLLHHAEKGTSLTLPEYISGSDELGTTQRARLDIALAARNAATAGTGQEHWGHACTICCKSFENLEGNMVKMHAAVSDGTALRRFCCAVPNCRNPLSSQRQHWCPEHMDTLVDLCVINGCTSRREPSHQTCGATAHRAAEDAHSARQQAFFQLSAQAKAVEKGEYYYNKGDADTPKTEGHQVKGQFTRNRTHNEQIIIRPCGIIVSRETFYHSESLPAVREFVKRTFPTLDLMPEYFFYDNNCNLRAYLEGAGDLDGHWQYTATPVDVFHHANKHKVTDVYCQRHCNPAAFPELTDTQGNWIFNTSIAEQTNVWLGKFKAVVRDMEAVHYDFFLDEMIKRKNRHTLAGLLQKGVHSWSVL